jgi:uncharacterized membrane protein HdeD (DUF308 family)
MSITLVRNWWVLALRGLIAVLFGLAAFLWPGGIGPQALAVLVPIFGAYALAHGLFAIGIAFMERGQFERWWVLEHWWVLLVEGVVGIAAGIMTLAWPSIAIGTLLYVIATWAIINGLLEIGAAVWLRDVFRDESLPMVGGILALIFGLILILRPDAPPLAVLWLFGAFAVSFGVLFTMFALRLRGLIEVREAAPQQVVEGAAQEQGEKPKRAEDSNDAVIDTTTLR